MGELTRVAQTDFIATVLYLFPGAKVVALNKRLCCQYCDKDHVPTWRRGGKIVERRFPDGRREWACHFCGRSCTATETKS